MSPGHAASQDHAKPGGDKGNPGNFGKVMKWVGYITAILSLAGAITGIVKVVAHRAETPLQIDTLLSSATVAIRGKDYASAWQSLDDAAKLNANSGKVRTAREDLAMTWLDDGIHAEPDGKFSGITTKLKPVLAQGVAATKLGPRQADLLAHIGWCYFLESRDGIFGPDPPGQYARRSRKTRTIRMRRRCGGTGFCGIARIWMRRRNTLRRVSLPSARVTTSDECSWTL